METNKEIWQFMAGCPSIAMTSKNFFNSRKLHAILRHLRLTGTMCSIYDYEKNAYMEEDKLTTFTNKFTKFFCESEHGVLSLQKFSWINNELGVTKFLEQIGWQNRNKGHIVEDFLNTVLMRNPLIKNYTKMMNVTTTMLMSVNFPIRQIYKNIFSKCQRSGFSKEIFQEFSQSCQSEKSL